MKIIPRMVFLKVFQGINAKSVDLISPLNSKSEGVKRQALLMYLEGLGFHSIGRILKVSHVSVLNWVKKYGDQVDSIRNDKPVQIMELDELYTYVGHKKTTDGSGLVLVEMTDNTLISSSVTGVQKQD